MGELHKGWIDYFKYQPCEDALVVYWICHSPWTMPSFKPWAWFWVL